MGRRFDVSATIPPSHRTLLHRVQMKTSIRGHRLNHCRSDHDAFQGFFQIKIWKSFRELINVVFMQLKWRVRICVTSWESSGSVRWYKRRRNVWPKQVFLSAQKENFLHFEEMQKPLFIFELTFFSVNHLQETFLLWEVESVQIKLNLRSFLADSNHV